MSDREKLHPEPNQELSQDELAQHKAEKLPDRDNLSLVNLNAATPINAAAALALAVSLLGLLGAAPAAAQTSPAPAQPLPAQPPLAQPAPPDQVQPAPAAPEPAATSPQVQDKQVVQAEGSSQAGSHNIVHVVNRVDHRFLLRGRVDLAHVDGLNASPSSPIWPPTSAISASRPTPRIPRPSRSRRSGR
jgi:hypothetical protein